MNDIASLTGMAGIFATIIFGALSVYFVIRRRYPGELTVLRERSLSLFDEIVKNLPEVSVLYNSQPVAENIVLLRASIFNTGAKDITAPMAVKPLAAVLPPGYRWLTARIIGSSDDINGEVVLKDERTLRFDLGLFRRKEFIRFEALAEVPVANASGDQSPAKRLDDNIKYEHRISDTATVRAADAPASLSRSKKRLLLAAAVYAVALAAMGVVASSVAKELQYIIRPDHRGTLQVSARPKFDGSIKLIGVREVYDATLSIEQFVALQPTPVVAPRRGLEYIDIFVVAALVLAVVYIPAYRDWRRLRRFGGALQEVSDDRSVSRSSNASSGEFRQIKNNGNS